jgi:hypothetical protein
VRIIVAVPVFERGDPFDDWGLKAGAQRDDTRANHHFTAAPLLTQFVVERTYSRRSVLFHGPLLFRLG